MSNSKKNSSKKQIPGAPETGPGSAKAGRPRKLPAPSGRQRPHREREAHNRLVEQARRDRADDHLPPDEIECQQTARRQLKKLKHERRDPVHDVGHKLGISEKEFHQDLLNIKAIRETEIGQELRDQLQRRVAGRRSSYGGIVAIQELLLWSKHPLTVRDCWSLLKQGRNDWPSYTLGPKCHDLPKHPSVVYDAIGGALRRDGQGRRPGLTDRIDRDLFDKALADTGRKLGTYGGEGFDRVLSVDGTLMRIALPQRQSFSAEDEAEIDGRFEAGFGSHGKSYVRGYNVMALVATSLTAPIAVTVEKANIGERGHVIKLFERVHKHWPDIAPEYLVGDSAFDADWRLYRDLMMGFGVNLVAPRNHEQRIPHHLRGGFQGVPVCTCTGSRRMMQMRSADGFWGPEKRRKLGLAPGEDAEQLMRQMRNRMRVRYACGEPGCQSKGVDLDPRQVIGGNQPNWRYATRLPHQPIHENFYPLRQDLLKNRNGSESVWNVMKLCGLDSSGAMVSRWQNTRAQQEATIKAKALRHSLLKLLERDGTLERIYAEAQAEGYLR